MNKHALRGSLWFPRQETFQVCHASLSNRHFYLFLIRLDEELAAQTRAAGCPCGGTLHCANYPRKPRGCPRWVRAAYETRLSFCCSRCRRRTTSQSVRFLGRRVYLGWVVVLCSARHAGQSTAPPPNPNTPAAPENAPTARSFVADSGYSKSSIVSRTRHVPNGGNRAVCADSWRSEAYPRTGNPQPEFGRPALRRGESGKGKNDDLKAMHGTLEKSLGVETRDSPEGRVCSSSPRGITPQTSPCSIRTAAKTISGGDRAQHRRY